MTGAFYYTLGNIQPRYRSALRMIQLVSLGKSKHIEEYGVDAILSPFMDSIQKLEQVQYSFKNQLLHFMLALV